MNNTGIVINARRLPQVEYQGQRVVTFEMIDAVHQRSKGTSAAAFRRNRHRFSHGKHFFELTSEVKRRMSQAGVFPPRTARGILITEMG